jgi:hypothetical protein
MIQPYTLPVEWLSRRASTPSVVFRQFGKGRLSELVATMQPGDELRKFDSPQWDWDQRAGRFGYAIIRDGRPLTMVVIRKS